MTTAPVPTVWVNGQRQTSAGHHVSARDRGFTLADGLFETMRAHHGVVFRLDRHLSRLERGLHALPPHALRQLLRQPHLLLELQELVLSAGSPYWDRLTSGEELDRLAAEGLQNLRAAREGPGKGRRTRPPREPSGSARPQR